MKEKKSKNSVCVIHRVLALINYTYSDSIAFYRWRENFGHWHSHCYGNILCFHFFFWNETKNMSNRMSQNTIYVSLYLCVIMSSRVGIQIYFSNNNRNERENNRTSNTCVHLCYLTVLFWAIACEVFENCIEEIKSVDK